MAIFTGAGVAIVTPMLPTGEVNYDKLGELIEFQIENHTDAIIRRVLHSDAWRASFGNQIYS